MAQEAAAAKCIILILRGSLIGAVLPWTSVGAQVVEERPAVSSSGEKSSESSAGSVAEEPNEIVVTATKRSLALSKVPQAVSAVNEQTLRELGADTFSGYARSLPGVSFTDRGPGQTQVAIRGISTGVDLDTGPEGTVGVYIDEIPVTVAMAQPDLKLFDIERVEVLRGPQGTLYGSGSMGGTLRIITPSPDLTAFERRVAGEGSITDSRSNGFSYAANAMLNVPLVEGRLGARMTGYYRDNDGYIDDVGLGIKNVNDERAWGGRLSLRAAPSDPLTIDLNLIYQQSENGGLPGYDVARGPFVKSRKVREVYEDDLKIANLTLRYDFGAVELVSATAYFDRSRFYIRDGSHLFAPNVAAPTYDYRAKNFTQEVRLTSTSESPFQWIFGAFYNHRIETFDQLAFLIPPVGTPFKIIETHGRTRIEQIAGFGELSYDLTPRLTLTGGVRVANIKTHTFRVDLRGSTVDTGQSASPISPKINLAWQGSDTFLLFGEISKGFRGGGTNLFVPPSPGLPSAPPTYGPDQLWSYQVGLKKRWFDRRLTANLSAFHIDWKDIQLQFNRADGFSWFVNGSAAKSDGIELETTAIPVPPLALAFNATYTNARLSQNAPSIPAPSGQQLPVTPKWKLFGSARYEAALSDSLRGFARIDTYYIGKTYNGLGASRLPQSAYSLTNLRFGIYRGNWEANVFVNNLFDKLAVLYSGSFVGQRRDEINRPRSFGISLDTRF